MNTDEIDRIVRSHNCEIFDGVFSSDTLPLHPQLLVSNSKPAKHPGKHWVALHINSETGEGEFFDPLGRPPNSVFARYLDKRCSSSWTYNNQQFQSIISTFCGYYCIYFCLLRCNGLDMRKIIQTLTSNAALINSIVHKLICLRHI